MLLLRMSHNRFFLRITEGRDFTDFEMLVAKTASSEEDHLHSALPGTRLVSKSRTLKKIRQI